ncbi:sulfotransferase [Lewinella cohaerens]|uniref:sulfotransferase n=1 Tax=Lewinella cohaerens TaxID=70995 RepID=UPI00039E6419|nr:sulfotransferase [Lewinella cohaerens]
MNFLKAISFARNAKQGSNIILTGVPRSGTTLICRLLCELPNMVALNEPIDRQFFPSPQKAQAAIADHFRQFRRSLYFEQSALARTRNGKIVDNAFAEDNPEDRSRLVTRSKVVFNKSLSPDFTLLMKHCAEFTLILPALQNHYLTYTVIRNPLAILASWHSVNVPVSRGKVAKSARLNPSFHAQLNEHSEDLLTRQLFILSWYFEQYQQLAERHIVRYEELIASPAKTLGRIVDHDSDFSFPALESRNANKLYKATDLSRLAERLLHSEGAYWAFYDRSSVKDLAQKMQADYEQ